MEKIVLLVQMDKTETYYNLNINKSKGKKLGLDSLGFSWIAGPDRGCWSTKDLRALPFPVEVKLLVKGINYG
jgi:hypothetical protein